MTFVCRGVAIVGILTVNLGLGIVWAESTSANSTPQLSVAPIPTAANPSPGTPQVTWSTGNGSPGNVTVGSKGIKQVLFAYGSEGSSPAPWISVGHVYVFKLYSISPARRLLARLTVGRGEPVDVIALAPTPKTTSATVDRLLQLLPFAWLAMFAVLCGLYARDIVRRA